MPGTSDPGCPGGVGGAKPSPLVCGHQQLLLSHLFTWTWWLDPLQVSSQVTAQFRVKSSCDFFRVWVCFPISLRTCWPLSAISSDSELDENRKEVQDKGCSRGISSTLGSLRGAAVQPSQSLPAQPTLSLQPLPVLSDWDRGQPVPLHFPSWPPIRSRFEVSGSLLILPVTLLPTSSWGFCTVIFPTCCPRPIPRIPIPESLPWPSCPLTGPRPTTAFLPRRLLVRALSPSHHHPVLSSLD